MNIKIKNYMFEFVRHIKYAGFRGRFGKIDGKIYRFFF